MFGKARAGRWSTRPTVFSPRHPVHDGDLGGPHECTHIDTQNAVAKDLVCDGSEDVNVAAAGIGDVIFYFLL